MRQSTSPRHWVDASGAKIDVSPTPVLSNRARVGCGTTGTDTVICVMNAGAIGAILRVLIETCCIGWWRAPGAVAQASLALIWRLE
jgi:hypothetical protein